MKDIKDLNNISEIVNYLKKNNLTLSAKTLKILKENLKEDILPRKYYPIFKENTKICNLFLSNPILWNDQAYNSIKMLAHNYDETTVLKYMATSIYEPQFFWDYLKDDRIPKIDQNNYYSLISKQQSCSDMDLVYRALTDSFIRNSEESLDQIKNIDYKNNREALKNKINILTKAKQANFAKYQALLLNKLTGFNPEEVKVIEKFLAILAHYDNFAVLNLIINEDTLKKLYPLIECFGQIRNVDEFNIVNNYFVRIACYLNLKENIRTEFDLECLDYDEYYIPLAITKRQQIAFAKGYSNLFLILEKMNQEVNKIKEEKWDLSRLKK